MHSINIYGAFTLIQAWDKALGWLQPSPTFPFNVWLCTVAERNNKNQNSWSLGSWQHRQLQRQQLWECPEPKTSTAADPPWLKEVIPAVSLNRVWMMRVIQKQTMEGGSADPDMHNPATCPTNSRKSCFKVPISACYGPGTLLNIRNTKVIKKVIDPTFIQQRLSTWGDFPPTQGIFGNVCRLFCLAKPGGAIHRYSPEMQLTILQ